MDNDLFGKVFNAATGVWAIFLVNLVAAWKIVPAILGRFNERRRDAAAEEAADWERLRAERDLARAERDRIHALWVKCEEEKMEALTRAVTCEATLQGYGEGRQKLAREEAARRLAEAAKPEGGSK